MHLLPLARVLGARSRTGAPILPVLLLTLVLAGVLAYQAYDAARSHRRASEAALRDYAAFGAWELGRSVAGELSTALSAATVRARLPVELDAGTGAEAGLARFAGRLREAMDWCDCAAAVHDFFLLDLNAGTVALRAERLAPTRDVWLREELLPRARRQAEATTFRREVLVTDAGSASGRERRRRGVSELVQETRIIHPEGARRSELRVLGTPLMPYEAVPGPEGEGRVFFTLLADARGEPTRAYGFWVDAPAVVGPVLRDVVAQVPLLPPSLLRGAANRDVLALTVTLSGDTLMDGGSVPAGLTGAVDTVSTALGELVIRAAVRPELAERLVIGGLPRSRLPVLLGAFALTLALVGIAVLQLRRQQELMRLRSDFISGVSHELRTPLAQIRLFSDLLGTGRLSEAQRGRSLRVIGEEARRLTYLVENVLHFSRSERQGSRIAPAPVEVAPLLREIAESFAPLARSRHATIEVRAEEGIVAELDRDAIRQIILNLLDNALKYGPPEQTIVLGLEANGDLVRIRVDDEGPGIPAAERERVWEPYRRLARDAESATGGSGIGLTVVRELVSLHGGRARIAERPGGGARIVVELPRSARAGAGERAEEVCA